MKKVLFLMLFLTCVQTATAAEVGVLMRSYHFDRSQEYNEKNYGIFGEYKNVFAIAYDNSYDDPAAMVGYQLNAYDNKYLSIDVNLGVVYGYGTPDGVKYGIGDADLYGHDLIPVALPVVTYSNDGYNFKAFIMYNVVAVGLSVDL